MRKPPADLKEMRAELGGVVHLAKHYKVSHRVITRWLKESGLPTERQAKVRKPPADFANLRETHHFNELKDHYRVNGKQITAWLKELGLTARKSAPPLRRCRPVPDDFRAKAPGMFISELAIYYGAGKQTVSRWIKETGITTKKFVNFGAPKPPAIPPAKNSMPHEIEANYLRKYMPVSPCDQDGKYQENGDHYRVGHTVMTIGEMVAKSETHKQREMNKVFRRSSARYSIHV